MKEMKDFATKRRVQNWTVPARFVAVQIFSGHIVHSVWSMYKTKNDLKYVDI